MDHLRLAFADEEIDVSGVPFRVEVVETGMFASVGLTDDPGTVHGAPVVAESTACGEEIHPFVVLPALEVEPHFIVVFLIDFIHLDLQAHLRDGGIVLFQHFCDVGAGEVGSIEDEPVQVRIVCHNVLPLPDLGDIGNIHANVLDEGEQIPRGNELGQIEKDL